MDDEITRTLRIKVKDVWYTASPMDEGQLVALQLLKTLPPTSVLGVLGAVFGASFGAEQYAALVLRMAGQELDVSDLMQALTKLAEATGKAKEKEAAKSGQPKGLDVAARLPDGEGS